MKTYLIKLQRYNKVLRAWMDHQFRTTKSAVRTHMSALKIQRQHGDVRAVKVSIIKR